MKTFLILVISFGTLTQSAIAKFEYDHPVAHLMVIKGVGENKCGSVATEGYACVIGFHEVTDNCFTGPCPVLSRDTAFCSPLPLSAGGGYTCPPSDECRRQEETNEIQIKRQPYFSPAMMRSPNYYQSKSSIAPNATDGH